MIPVKKFLISVSENIRIGKNMELSFIKVPKVQEIAQNSKPCRGTTANCHDQEVLNLIGNRKEGLIQHFNILTHQSYCLNS